MNTFNRVVLILLLIVAMFACSLALIFPLETLQVVARQAGLLADVLGQVRSEILLATGILLTVSAIAVGVLLIILEVKRTPTRSINVEQASGGHVTLSVASIAEQLKVELSQLDDVLLVKPKVLPRRKGVAVEVDVRISAESGVPAKAQRIVETIKFVLVDKMGLKLARPPKVNIEAVLPGPGNRQVSPEPSPAPVVASMLPDTTEEDSEFS